jgi:hypothetical protein
MRKSKPSEPKPRMIKFSVYVSSEVFDALLFEARKDGRPLSQWVARRLADYVRLTSYHYLQRKESEHAEARTDC